MSALLRAWLLTAVLGFFQCTAWAGFPITVTDLAGRQVLLHQPPQRLFVANGNHMMALLMLEREDPWARLAAWNNALDSSDPTTWRWLRDRWPHAAQVPRLKMGADVHADIERLLSFKPDLLLLDLETRKAVESGPLQRVARRMGIPILYADTSRDPVRNVPRTVTLLGQVLGQQARAAEYVHFYAERLARLQAHRLPPAQRPTVFLEVRAGRMGLEQCCYTQGYTAWGQMIEVAGGRNIGSQLLRGVTGDVTVETLMRLKPALYLMTGTQQRRRGARTIPFGLGADEATTQAALRALMQRPGLSLAARHPQQCVMALTHQFYDNVMNIVGLEYLAQALQPGLRAQLAPADTYREIVRRFTTLPQTPFVFQTALGWDGQACTADPPA